MKHFIGPDLEKADGIDMELMTDAMQAASRSGYKYMDDLYKHGEPVVIHGRHKLATVIPREGNLIALSVIGIKSSIVFIPRVNGAIQLNLLGPEDGAYGSHTIYLQTDAYGKFFASKKGYQDIDQSVKHPGHPVVSWLAFGERGASSETMAATMFPEIVGKQFEDDPYYSTSYPHDPSALGRCLKFLEDVPEGLDRLDKMREAGPVWNAFVDRWDELVATYHAEKAESDTGTKTYHMMKDIIASAEETVSPR